MTDKFIKRNLIKVIILAFAVVLSLAPWGAEVKAAEDEITYNDLASKYKELVKKENKISVSEFFGASEDTEEVAEEEPLDMLYSSIPDKIKAELPSKDEISYNSFGADFFFEKIKNALGIQSRPLLQSASEIMALLLLASVVKRFAEGAEKGTSRAFEMLILAAVCVSVLKTGIFSPREAGGFLVTLSEVSNALLPTMTVLLCATGNAGSAALLGQNAAIISTLSQYLFSRVLYPMISACAGLCIAGCVTGEKTAFSLSGFFRKTATFITVFSVTFFVFVMAVQSTFASAADGLGIKTVKFAASSFIPIVGGAVSETFNVVGAGLGYVKNTCGGVSLAVILIILLPTVVGLLLRKLFYLLFSSLSGMLDLGGAEKFFLELGALNDCLLAVCISASVVFIILIIFVINCSVKIGGV